MRQARKKSKGPVVKLEQIDRLIAGIRREQKELEDVPHPHPPPEPGPGRATILHGFLCPRDCPIQARERTLYGRLRRLGKMQQTVLVDLARSRVKARRVPSSAVTRETYEQALARVEAMNTKRPREELAKQLLMSRQGLLDWESLNLRKR